MKNEGEYHTRMRGDDGKSSVRRKKTTKKPAKKEAAPEAKKEAKPDGHNKIPCGLCGGPSRVLDQQLFKSVTEKPLLHRVRYCDECDHRFISTETPS